MTKPIQSQVVQACLQILFWLGWIHTESIDVLTAILTVGCIHKSDIEQEQEYIDEKETKLAVILYWNEVFDQCYNTS